MAKGGRIRNARVRLARWERREERVCEEGIARYGRGDGGMGGRAEGVDRRIPVILLVSEWRRRYSARVKGTGCRGGLEWFALPERRTRLTTRGGADVEGKLSVGVSVLHQGSASLSG